MIEWATNTKLYISTFQYHLSKHNDGQNLALLYILYISGSNCHIIMNHQRARLDKICTSTENLANYCSQSAPQRTECTFSERVESPCVFPCRGGGGRGGGHRFARAWLWEKATRPSSCCQTDTDTAALIDDDASLACTWSPAWWSQCRAAAASSSSGRCSGSCHHHVGGIQNHAANGGGYPEVEVPDKERFQAVRQRAQRYDPQHGGGHGDAVSGLLPQREGRRAAHPAQDERRGPVLVRPLRGVRGGHVAGHGQ
jgi:hypothetical protein